MRQNLDRPRKHWIASLLIAATCSFPAWVFAAEPELGGYCAMGLVKHQRIKTDCTANWTSKEGKLYCFSSEAAKSEFLTTADENIQRATDNYAATDIVDTANEMGKFSSDDVQTYVDKMITDKSAKNGGVFVLEDPVTDTTIPLIYEKIDFTRTIDGYGFFPDVIFHAKGDEAQKYLVDFWLAPKNGALTILETRIYKTPIKSGGSWSMMQRQPKPWWWIPAAEHPGQTEQKRSWEIMSAIDGYIAAEGKNGILSLKDDKTGEELALKYVDIHQPVRRLKDDGEYFVCTDFRKAGTNDQFYDIDFWVGAEEGNMTVTKVKVHKVPILKDGSYVQIPRYNFDSKTFEEIP